MNLLFGKKWFSWPRLLGLLVTGALLFFLGRQIDLSTVGAALRRMNAAWLGLAFLVYGGALVAGGWRWHVALRMVDRAIHPSASVRLALVGHFLFVVLLGAVGGDLAKSAIYARWYRFALPEVVAAAPLDRLLAFGGVVLSGSLALLLAGVSGGFAQMHRLQLHLPGVWLLAGLGAVAVAAAAGLCIRPRGESPWARAVRAFRAGGWRLAVSPDAAALGLMWAFVSQAALAAVFACCFRAVAGSPVSWLQLAWTFPAITLLSCLPFTVAGAGVRDVAAITLLGLYGVPAGDGVAASMLALFLKLLWAGIGGAVLWREQNFYGNHPPLPLPQSLSIVMPVLNEAGALPETIRRARAVPEVCEIIVVDGGSQDATRALAAQLGCRVLASPPGRGGQMRLGAAQARGEVVLLLHADTWLPPDAGRAALNCLRDATVVAGGFWKTFRDGSPLLLGSRWRCGLRLLAGRRILGDQAMFIRRETLERIGGVPDMPLMEEFELCRRLRRAGRLALADATVTTSARRFARLGVMRTYWRMWRVAALYRLGKPPHELRRLYERD